MAQLTWMVTGCISGFGEKFVPAIVARGDRVVATGLNASNSIKHLEGPNVAILDLDITATQIELDRKIKEALGFFGGIDILVNNAGYLRAGVMEEVSGERFMAVYETNVIGAINVTRAILPHFREKNRGKLVFLGSLFGWQGDIGLSPYCASKFALEGVVESLQKELAPFGIKSIIFNPGHFRTKIISPENVKYEIDPIDAYAEINKAVMAGGAARDGNQPGDPSKAVERMIDVVRGEGMAAGKDLPKMLPLGSDAMAVIKKKCLETLEICKEWEAVVNSTDF